MKCVQMSLNDMRRKATEGDKEERWKMLLKDRNIIIYVHIQTYIHTYTYQNTMVGQDGWRNMLGYFTVWAFAVITGNSGWKYDI